MMVRGDAQVLDEIRTMDGVSPEHLRALLKKLEAGSLAPDPPHTR